MLYEVITRVLVHLVNNIAENRFLNLQPLLKSGLFGDLFLALYGQGNVFFTKNRVDPIKSIGCFRKTDIGSALIDGFLYLNRGHPGMKSSSDMVCHGFQGLTGGQHNQSDQLPHSIRQLPLTGDFAKDKTILNSESYNFV